MFRFFISLLLYATSVFSQDCFIETKENIFFVRSNSSLNFIEKSHCPQNIKKEFNNFIKSSHGIMRSSDVERILAEKFHLPVRISPLRINVHDIEKAVKESLVLPHDWTMKGIKILGKEMLLFSGNNIEMKINCHNCYSLGRKQVKLEFVDKIKKTTFTEWIKGEILVKASAVFLKETLTFNNKPLSKKDFIIKHIYTSRPEDLFLQINKVHFYKANKNIPKGSVLRKTDITPIKLVSPNVLTNVVYQKGNLFLKVKARPMRVGYYGDTIQLKRPKSHTIITGKVVGHRKVVVEI